MVRDQSSILHPHLPSRTTPRTLRPADTEPPFHVRRSLFDIRYSPFASFTFMIRVHGYPFVVLVGREPIAWLREGRVMQCFSLLSRVKTME